MHARAPRPRRWALALALAFAAAALSPGAADARRRRHRPETYVFSLFKVELKDGLPADLEGQVRSQVKAQIADHEALEPKLEKDAPDPKKEPKKLARYLKRKHKRAFKVNVEVTEYESQLEENDRSKARMLVVRISLRMFGETIPKRVMAFSGDGSATVKVEVGKKVRDRDREYANNEAIKLAVADAIEASIKKLRAPPPSKKFPGRRKK